MSIKEDQKNGMTKIEVHPDPLTNDRQHSLLAASFLASCSRCCAVLFFILSITIEASELMQISWSRHPKRNTLDFDRCGYVWDGLTVADSWSNHLSLTIHWVNSTQVRSSRNNLQKTSDCTMHREFNQYIETRDDLITLIMQVEFINCRKGKGRAGKGNAGLG